VPEELQQRTERAQMATTPMILVVLAGCLFMAIVGYHLVGALEMSWNGFKSIAGLAGVVLILVVIYNLIHILPPMRR
jgi:hypothetical protein